MAQEDDVERLFSWLQTPDIRYREFAGIREVSDAVVALETEVARPVLNPPAPGHVQLDEEYPQDQFPDQSQVIVKVEPEAGGPAITPSQHAAAEHSVSQGETVASPDVIPRGPAMIAPIPTPPTRAEPVFPPGGAPPQVSPMSEARPSPPVPPPPPVSVTPPQSGAAAARELLGGAYGDHGDTPAATEPGHPAEGGGPRALDSVFSRLAGGPAENRERDRSSRSPGLSSTTDRPR
jgi:hypothetical protein